MNPAKLHPVLLQNLTLTTRALETEAADGPWPVIVRVRAVRSLAADGAESAPPLQVEREIPRFNALSGWATRDEIAALSEHSEIELVWLDEPVFAVLDRSVAQAGIAPIWATGNEGAGIKIAVIDTGVDAQHPDLAGRVIASADFTKEGDFDANGHGTLVASIAAGNGAASNGRYRGVAPQAQILAAKVLSSDGAGRMSFVVAALEWALDNGAQVINLSLGSHTKADGSDPISDACNQAVAEGAVVVAAAGNEGPDPRTLNAPGTARDVITIGALTRDNGVARFSSRGPTADGRIKPDVLFPGDEIMGARAKDTAIGTVNPENELYVATSGTSMATPHASGLVALLLAANPALTPAQIKEILRNVAQSVDVDENSQGRGRVDGARALALALGQNPDAIPPRDPSVAPDPEEDDWFAGLLRLLGVGRKG